MVRHLITPHPDTKKYVQCPHCEAILEFTADDEIMGIEYLDFHPISSWKIKCSSCKAEITTKVDSDIFCGNIYISEDDF